MPEMPRVKLIYPPYSWAGWDGPHLAIPLLSTYLRSVGIDSSYVDLNVRFRHYLARPGGELERFAVAILNEYLAFQRMDSLSPAEARAVGRLLKVISTIPGTLVQEFLARGEAVDGPLGGTGIGPFNLELAIAQLAELAEELPGLSEGVLELVRNRTYSRQPLLDRFLGWGSVADEIDDALTADVVGINVSFSVQLGAALTIAHHVKQRAGHVTVVLGGTQLTLLPKEDQDALAALPFVDGIVVLQGEVPLATLARTVAVGGPLERVPNLITRSEDGTILRSETIPALHPDDIPTPRLNEAELPLYGDAPQFSLLVARGCYWGKCRYCDYARLRHPADPRYVCRGPERVVQDAERFAEKYGARRFWLVTDALPPRWTRQFCQEVIARGVKAGFSSYMRPETTKAITPELVSLMREAGFTSVVLGAESFSDRVLEVMNKGTTGVEVERTLRLLADSGISVTLNVIPDYPTATFDEAVADLRTIVANAPWIDALNGQAFDLTDETEVAREPAKYGIAIDREMGRSSSRHGAHSLRFTRTAGMNSAEQKTLMRAFDELKERYLPRLWSSGENSSRVRHEDFDWTGSLIRFRPFLPLPSRFSLAEEGAPDDVTILVVPTLGCTVEIPRYHERLLALLRSLGPAAVPYPEFRDVFAQDVRTVEPDISDDEVDRMCRGVVVDFVDAAFIDHLEGGGVEGVPPLARPTPLLASVLGQPHAPAPGSDPPR